MSKENTSTTTKEKQEEAEKCLGHSATLPQTTEELYDSLGNPGKLQLLWFFLLAFNLVSVSPNAVVGALFGYIPGHVCNATVDWSAYENNGEFVLDVNSLVPAPNFSIPGQNNLGYSINSTTTASSSSSSSSSSTNSSAAGLDLRTTRNSSFAPGLRLERGECAVRLVSSGGRGGAPGQYINASRTCSKGEWVYYVDEGESSIVTDFDLVCELSYLSHLASSLYYLGLILANFTLGYASDRLGRRPVILLSLHLMVITGLGIAFSPNFAVFVALRVFMGILAQGLQSATFVLVLEYFSTKHRGAAGGFLQCFWGVGTLYVSGVAWLVKDWRHIQLGMLAPVVISAFSMWYVGESIRWMVARGRTRQAAHVITRIAAFNKVDNPLGQGGDHSQLEQIIDKQEMEKKGAEVAGKQQLVREKGSYWMLVRTPVMRKRTICLSTVVFGINICYFGMTYNNANLAGDKYLNFFLGSLTETIAYTAGAFVVLRLGRRRTVFLCLLVGGACCLVSGLIPNKPGAARIWITIFSVLGRFVVSGCFCASDTFVAELFPTVVRSMGVGVCTFAARMGSMLAPLIMALSKVGGRSLPPLVFATFAIAGTLTIGLLPETLGQHLPETVEDVEKGHDSKVADYELVVSDPLADDTEPGGKGRANGDSGRALG